MIKVYSAANLQDAYLLRDLLLQAGVMARVLNEHAQGALGDVPFASAYPQVWIEQRHQEDHARRVIKDFENHPNDASTHNCFSCGEINPGAFDICWSCGVLLPAST